MQSPRLIILLSIFSILFVSSCSLKKIDEESELITNRGLIKGDINITSQISAPVSVLLFKKEQESIVFINSYMLNGKNTYRFHVSPGTYQIAAFQDLNKDGLYQRSEDAAIYGGTRSEDAESITVNAGDAIMLETLIIAKPLISDKETDNISFDHVIDHVGEILSLSDSRFERDIGSLGLWRPMTFLKQYGVGLYLLQPYKAHLIPVIFIHGAGGNPREFSEMINSLDRDYYQPWVLHYPSGFSLDIVSDYLIESIIQLQSQYKFKQFSLVAHSMGGLILRSAVMKFKSSGNKADITSAMTINSPMKGMTSAASGVKMSPIVVASWYDVAKDSQFIKDLHSWRWPEDIPYFLIFSYEENEGGDGVVALESQIPISLQEEATKVYGFNSGHAKVLTNDDFLKSFKRIMEYKPYQ